MKVFIFNKQTDISLCPYKTKSAVAFILDFLKIKTNEIVIHFVSKKKICSLHKELFNDPSFTDTITLPLDSPNQKEVYHILGECFICPKAAQDFCHDNKKNSSAVYQEITLYLIHSILHLVGFEDTSIKGKKMMRLKEQLILNEIINNNLILSPKNLSNHL